MICHFCRWFLLPAILSCAFGAQSVRVTSGAPSVTLTAAAPWNSIGRSGQPMRWEARIHDFGDLPATGINFGPVRLVKHSSNSVYASSTEASGTYDTLLNNGPHVPNCCAGKNDILVRVQRDVANLQYTLEICGTASGGCQTATTKILTFGPPSWNGVRTELTPGYSVAFIRWFSTVVPLGTPIPIAPVAADLGDWEFETGLADTSGNHLDLSGGTVAYGPTPVYAPVCNAGKPRGLRAGYPADLDGTASYPLDGSNTLTYFWQQAAGPSISWQDPRQIRRGPLRAMPSPRVQGLIPGSYKFQLTVTDSSGQSSACSVDYGAVATDDNGVVITNNPAVDTLLGPMVRYGASPWPWFDDRNQAVADLQIANMDAYYGAYWDVSDPGVITVTNGSVTVTGVGTTFTNTVCQGPANPTVPRASLVVWYPTGAPGETGRRTMPVASCQSDTLLTMAKAWKDDIPDGANLNYADDAAGGTWAYSSAPANFYDNVAAFYALYYRSGLVAYRDAARKLADRFWLCPQMDRGNSYVGNGNGGAWASRNSSIMGLVLRALDGRPDMWPGLRKIFDLHWAVYFAANGAAQSYLPSVGDVRETAYRFATLCYGALFDPDAANRTKYKSWVSQTISGFFTKARFPEGTWYQLWADYNSWLPATTSVTLTHGSMAVVGNGTSWTASQFNKVGTEWPVTWFTKSSAMPASNADGDTATYVASFVDATHLLLDRPYEGTTGTHGWVVGVPPSPYVGYGSMPYQAGIMAATFDFAARALEDGDPVNAALAHRYNVEYANWMKTSAYRPSTKSVYYGAGFANCQQPIAENNSSCTGNWGAAMARVMNGLAIRGMMPAYQYSKDPALKDFIDMLYNAMWAKPGTCPAGSSLCVPDDYYMTAYDDGDVDLTGTPPNGAAPKWLGMMWGFGGLAAWPGYRAGGPQASEAGVFYVAFNLGTVQGATAAQVKTTGPTGETARTPCASMPCEVRVTGPEGDYHVELEYLSSSGGVIRKSALPVFQAIRGSGAGGQ